MKRVVINVLFFVVIVILVGLMEECNPDIHLLYEEVTEWLIGKVQLVSSGNWR